MTHPRFVSTGAFRTTDLGEIIALCLEYGIEGLELSSGGIALDNGRLQELERLAGGGRLSFLVHNYFPAPAQPFVLNLAAQDPATLKASRDHCRRAIELCARLGAPFYSVHAGFCYQATPEKLGRDQTGLPRFPRHAALEIFTESLGILGSYAARYDLDLLVENNVLTPENAVAGGNALLLGATAGELRELLATLSAPNIFALLDVGHLKVTARTLGLDLVKEMAIIAPLVRAVHLSDNDGIHDSNRKADPASWFWEPLRALPEQSVFVLEVYKLLPAEIIEQLRLIGSKTTTCHPQTPN